MSVIIRLVANNNTTKRFFFFFLKSFRLFFPAKTVHRKIIETSGKLENLDDSTESNQFGNQDKIEESIVPVEPHDNDDDDDEVIGNDDDDDDDDRADKSMDNEKTVNPEDLGNNEDYYDAYEDNGENPETKPEKSQEVAIFKNSYQEDKREKNNFLVTAIIPQDMKIKPFKNGDDWMTMNQDQVVAEKKPETVGKGKKFTCQLSIDFTPKTSQEKSSMMMATNETLAIENKKGEHVGDSANRFDVIASDSKQGDNSVVTYKKNNKSLEIKITQTDSKDNSNNNKNFLQQKMILEFGKNEKSTGSNSAGKSPKFEFNLALTNLGVGKKTNVDSNSEKENLELNLPEERNNEALASSRTEWNDATDELPEEEKSYTDENPRYKVDIPPSEPGNDLDEKRSIFGSGGSDDYKDENDSNEPATELKTYEDSLRYEKNLEFLQGKTTKKIKGEDGDENGENENENVNDGDGGDGDDNNNNDDGYDDDDVTKDKPSAILIQNGQTKLALIRYK